MRRVGGQPSPRGVAAEKQSGGRRVNKSSEKRRAAASENKQFGSTALMKSSLVVEKEEKGKPKSWLLKTINDGINQILEEKETQNLIKKITELQPKIDAEIERFLKDKKYLEQKNKSESNQDENYVVFENIEKLDKLLEEIDSQGIRKFCADIYLLIGKLTDALTQYTKNSNKAPAYLRLMQAELAREEGKNKVVIEYCKKIISSGNQSYFANAYYLLAEAYSKIAEACNNECSFNDAITNIQFALKFKNDDKIISVDSRDVETYMKLASNIMDKEKIATDASWKGKESNEESDSQSESRWCSLQ